MVRRREPVIEAIDDHMAAMLRRKTPTERLASTFAMWRFARDRTMACLKQQHPDWNETQLKAELRRRMLGSD
jgi:hypothetical protein